MFRPVVLGLLGLLCAPLAHAAPETHDGFFLQFNVGPAHQSWTKTTPGTSNTVEVTGRGSMFDFKIGGAVRPNIIVFSQLTGTNVRGPESSFKVGGKQMSLTSDDISTGTTGFGGGVMYYVAEQGIYVSASALVLSLRLRDETLDDTAEGLGSEKDEVFTNQDFGFQFRVGKEWWVSANWGLGIAAAYTYASLTDAIDEESEWTVNNIGLTFSATYN